MAVFKDNLGSCRSFLHLELCVLEFVQVPILSLLPFLSLYWLNHVGRKNAQCLLRHLLVVDLDLKFSSALFGLALSLLLEPVVLLDLLQFCIHHKILFLSPLEPIL